MSVLIEWECALDHNQCLTNNIKFDFFVFSPMRAAAQRGYNWHCTPSSRLGHKVDHQPQLNKIVPFENCVSRLPNELISMILLVSSGLKLARSASWCVNLSIFHDLLTYKLILVSLWTVMWERKDKEEEKTNNSWRPVAEMKLTWEILEVLGTGWKTFRTYSQEDLSKLISIFPYARTRFHGWILVASEQVANDLLKIGNPSWIQVSFNIQESDVSQIDPSDFNGGWQVCGVKWTVAALLINVVKSKWYFPIGLYPMQEYKVQYSTAHIQ